MPLTAVFFDIGETLVDETGPMGKWADWLEVPRLTFFAALGAVMAHETRPALRHAIDIVRPDLDSIAFVREHRETGFTVDDLYSDALPTLLQVRDMGYRVGIAGNQPPMADGVIRASGLPFEWLLISAIEGVHKPDPAFFERILEVSGLRAESIAYVGDRVDNDVLPAHAAGMRAVHVRRGPWGVLQADWPGAQCAALRLRTLGELPACLADL
jgi:FMN phosphatase YigB (HAD superfamily)